MKTGFICAVLSLLAAGILFFGCDSGGGDDDDSAALNETFDNWAGGVFMAKGDASAYADNDTMVSIDGHDALAIHADAEDNSGNGFSVEFQLDLLNAPVDMSGEDYVISFDIYVPAAMKALNPSVQYGFYETANWTPIYSGWWSGSLIADQWVTITSPIDTSGVAGGIDYSQFADDPGDWQFDVVRIQFILPDAVAGAEILFYIDNLVVARPTD